MNLLLDTHILIWALNDDPRLPKRARKMIVDADNTIYYSSVSVWEISIKHTNHPDNVSFDAKDFVHYCQEAGFLAMDLKDKHVFSLESLRREESAPPHHDPFDRMLIAQAKSENMAFITHDSTLSYYNENCIIEV